MYLPGFKMQISVHKAILRPLWGSTFNVNFLQQRIATVGRELDKGDRRIVVVNQCFQALTLVLLMN